MTVSFLYRISRGYTTKGERDSNAHLFGIKNSRTVAGQIILSTRNALFICMDLEVVDLKPSRWSSISRLSIASASSICQEAARARARKLPTG
jgi:hypothetical protein